MPNFPGLHIEKAVDLYPGKGSIIGIYSGLKKSLSFHSLVVACDMPFLNTPLLQYMLEISGGFDIVVPKIGDWFEPLHAVYSKNCLAFMQELIEHDNLRIIELFNNVRVRAIEQTEIEKFDSEHLSFFNINTQDDMERAKKLASEANG
jgi:molybdopterin-guanine dinucleotide biosynthesis protein A